MIKQLYTVNYKVNESLLYNLQFINLTKRYSRKEFRKLCEFIMDEELTYIKGHTPATYTKLTEEFYKMRGLIQSLANRDFVILSSMVMDIDGYTLKVTDSTNYDTKKER